MSVANTAATEDCPSCASRLVTARNAAPWCPECEWNLALYEPDRHGRILGFGSTAA